MDRFEARVAVREALARAGPDRRREAPVHAQRRALAARPKRADRAAAVAAVVRQGRAAGEGRGRRRARRPRRRPPEGARAPLVRWVDNMHDWTITRQLWWGHRIPVWYGARRRDRSAVGPGRGAARGLDARTRTSSTPGSPRACGRSPRWAGRSKTPDLEKFYPTSVLVTGYDILFFWVARMMMFGPLRDAGPAGWRSRSTPSRCTAWSATSSARRCRSRSATPSIPTSGWTSTAPTPSASRWPAGPTRAPTRRSATTTSPPPRNFGTKLWNAARFALANGASPALPLPGRADRRRPLDPRPAARGHRADRRAAGGLPVRQGRRGALPLHVGRALRLVPGAGQAAAPRRQAPPTAPARCSATSSTCWCGCCTRSSPFLTEAL